MPNSERQPGESYNQWQDRLREKEIEEENKEIDDKQKAKIAKELGLDPDDPKVKETWWNRVRY